MELKTLGLKRYTLITTGAVIKDTVILPPGDTILIGKGQPITYLGQPDRPAILSPPGSRLVMRDVTLQDVRRTDRAPVQPHPLWAGVVMHNAHHSVLDNVTIEGFTFGLDSDNSYYCDHSRCQFRFNDVGARTTVGNVSAFRQCHFEYNRIGVIDAVRMTGCSYEGMWEEAVRFTQPAAQCKIEDGYFESNCQRNWKRNPPTVQRRPGLADIVATQPTILVVEGATYFAGTYSNPEERDYADAPTHRIAGDFHALSLFGTARFFTAGDRQKPHVMIPPGGKLLDGLIGEHPLVGRYGENEPASATA